MCWTDTLVFNEGSSSRKYCFYRTQEGGALIQIVNGQFDFDTTGCATKWKHAGADMPVAGINREIAVKALFDIIGVPDYIGQRVVHGGDVNQPVVINDEVLARIEACARLAPKHNPLALTLIRRIRELHPEVLQVAVFDTAFHRTIPPMNARYGLPNVPEIRHIDERYGFHGTSYEFIARQLPKYVPNAFDGDMVIIAHTGSGASMCIVRYNGEKKCWLSWYCTLGFGTSGNGPMHGTRTPIDGDAMLEIIRSVSGDCDRAQRIILNESGLKGLSGVGDHLAVVKVTADDPSHQAHLQASFAITLYTERAIEAFGMLAGKAHAHGRLVGVVWTAGVGEHAPWYRTETARAIPGLKLHHHLNASITRGPITTKKSKILGIVIPTDEEQMIAQHTAALLSRHRAAIAAE